MGYNARLNPMTAVTNFGSVATDSSALHAVFTPHFAGQVVGVRLVNGATAAIASGTTAGSALNVYVMKNASDTAASAISSSALGSVATLATVNLTMSTSTSLQRFSAGDVYCAQLVGGVGNDADNSGAIVQISYMYAWSQSGTATP
jgi:hypothetical protein